MTYILRTINGDEYRIDEKTRASLAKMLVSPREERPAFVELRSIGAIIATASITSVVKEAYDRTKERAPTLEEDAAEFQRRWEERKSGRGEA